jgi:protein TonB
VGAPTCGMRCAGSASDTPFMKPIFPAIGYKFAVAALVLSAAGAASAQFAMAPAPTPNAALKPSSAHTAKAYRTDGAKHIYAMYGKHIYKGRMPPLLYGIAVVETEIDENGQVLDVNIIRKPAAAEVGPWVVEMIKKSGPFPPPLQMGRVRYTDVWLVHKSGKFQLDTLTEGQN